MARMNTVNRCVVVGLGNPILTDDAIGVLVARALGAMPCLAGVDVRESCRGGLDLLEMIVGYDEAHIVDAVVSNRAPPGTTRRLDLQHLPRGLTLASSHEVDLPTAIELGHRLVLALPAEIVVWAIEVIDPFTVGAEMTPCLRAALTGCVQTVLNGLARRAGCG